MYNLKTKTLTDKRELLKIKALSLVAEVRIIRQQEAKQLAFTRKHAIDPQLQREMYLHRKGLRGTARLTHLARGFIKGRDLPSMENHPKDLLFGRDWDAIRVMVKKYGSAESLAHFDAQRAQYEFKAYSIPGEMLAHHNARKVKVAEA